MGESLELRKSERRSHEWMRNFIEIPWNADRMMAANGFVRAWMPRSNREDVCMAGQPNILWILTTQWRAMATGYTGDANARTPWLDGLASEAVDFSQATTPHPLGPQARAALLTGKLCPENGVRGYWDALPANARTVAHALNNRGYATAHV